MDYEAVADTSDAMREAVNAIVQGFVADGFTTAEARAVTAGMFASMVPKQGAS